MSRYALPARIRLKPSEPLPGERNLFRKGEILAQAQTLPDLVSPKSQHRTPIDIEHLLWWAIGQTGYLPWRGVSDRELMFNHGYNVIPKGCAQSYHGSQPLLRRGISDDATIVIEAVKLLKDVGITGVVIACARDHDRPNWFPGVVPKRVYRKVYGRKRGKRRGRPIMIQEWDIDPKAICAARDVYARWHAALSAVAMTLREELIAWNINSFAALDRPWEITEEKTY